MQPCILIFGFGYSAPFLAKKLAECNFDIIGTSRQPQIIANYSSSAYELIDFSRESVSHHLSKVTHILVSTPPSEQIGDPVLANFRELLKRFSTQIQWLGYLSSTGIYGNHRGAWVDESSASISPGEKSQLRLNAEQEWNSFSAAGFPLHIFRLAGIYGPQKNALARLKAGKQTTVYKKGHFFSRIHVEDFARVILASIEKPNPLSVYNVADDEPAPSELVDAYAASLLNQRPLPLTPFNKAQLSAMEKDFYSHNRRVCNAKIKKELLIQLKYPSYREGLKELLNTF